MTSCLGKSCSYGLLCVSFVYVYHFLCMFPFGFEEGMWDLFVLIPDHCLSIYFGYSGFILVFKVLLFDTHVIQDEDSIETTYCDTRVSQYVVSIQSSSWIHHHRFYS